MSIGYVLQQAGFKMGLNPADTEGDRKVLLRFLNEGATELWEQADVEGSLWEQMFQVNGDQMIALPPYVGPLRAMREYNTHVAWKLSNMRPRYNQINWMDRWRQWRQKGTSPIMYPVANQSQMTVTVATLDNPPITVSVVGPTPFATNTFEDLVMDSSCTQVKDAAGNVTAYTKTTTNQFLDVTAFKKDRVNGCDVTLSDADGNILSQLPNNQLLMRYRLIDVSLYPWSNTDMSIADHYMEVLYKKALPWFENDDDEYPTPGHDWILVNKMLQLWCEEQGKGPEAVAYDAKATRSLARKKMDAERGVEQEVSLGENTHDTLLPRNRPMGPARYQGQIYY